MSSPKGYLCLVLHGHLPFLRHPEHPECLEEDWFFEALTEVYLPLLEMFHRLREEGLEYRLAFSLSPTLTAMWKDPLMTLRYEAHLANLIRLSQAECRRTSGLPEYPLATMYRDRFTWIRRLWLEKFHRNVNGAFRSLRESGHLELLTTTATHGFLPLMEVHPAAIRAQVRVGLLQFQADFGFTPEGFWLPECGFTPRVGEILREEGIRYTFLETHGILHATPRPKFGVYAPVATPQGLILFGRDPETAQQVWSSIDGYPGDPWYREFYRDIGFDLEESYVKPFLAHGGNRSWTGIKYYRITGKGNRKELYLLDVARQRAKEHAGDFLFNRERQAEHLCGVMGQPPMVVSMYDAELFGHWWFEGPLWLEELLRRFDANRSLVQLATPSQVLRTIPRVQKVSPHLSTWGWKGYNEVWLQGSNAWIYPHLDRAAWRMEELALGYARGHGLRKRAINQALRELLLAQASDWAFILATGTATEYAKRRVSRHIGRFHRLYDQVRNNQIDEAWLNELVRQDNLFDFLDFTTAWPIGA